MPTPAPTTCPALSRRPPRTPCCPTSSFEQGVEFDINNGNTELSQWTGSAWDNGPNDWGGIPDAQLIGAHIAYADGYGVELSIPLADIGVTLSSTVHLQVYTTQHGHFNGAYDTLPSDLPTASIYSPTIQHTFATLELPGEPVEPTPPPAGDLPELAFGSAAYQTNESDGTASISIHAVGAVTRPLTVTAHALPGTASVADFAPLTTTLIVGPVITSTTFTVTLVNDTDDEPDETILLDLATPLNAVLGQPDAAVLTILDDDFIEQPILLRILLPLIRR
jgi:hypothetical protein